jgi:hypothetical protein
VPDPGAAPEEVAAKAALVMASAVTAVPAMTAIARRPVRERWYFMTVVLW